MNRLINGDCLQVVPRLGKFDMIFADPPDNIGLNYAGYVDRLSQDEYLHWLERCVDVFTAAAPTTWISFNSRWTTAMGNILFKRQHLKVLPCVQTFSFGQQRSSDLKNCHRPLWRLCQPDAVLYPEQAKEVTARQLMGDKRAAAGGAVPSDWFDFPRVTGNSEQRRSWHPTQLHHDVVVRCVKLCTLPQGRVLDPFGGTGTTLRVCKALQRECTLVEMDKFYCSKIAEEHQLTVEDMAVC